MLRKAQALARGAVVKRTSQPGEEGEEMETEREIHTETEHDVEEYDQHHRYAIHKVSSGPHPEWAFGHITPACK